jgi:hypothetical protein
MEDEQVTEDLELRAIAVLIDVVKIHKNEIKELRDEIEKMKVTISKLQDDVNLALL